MANTPEIQFRGLDENYPAIGWRSARWWVRTSEAAFLIVGLYEVREPGRIEWSAWNQQTSRDLKKGSERFDNLVALVSERMKEVQREDALT